MRISAFPDPGHEICWLLKAALTANLPDSLVVMKCGIAFFKKRLLFLLLMQPPMLLRLYKHATSPYFCRLTPRCWYFRQVEGEKRHHQSMRSNNLKRKRGWRRLKRTKKITTRPLNVKNEEAKNTQDNILQPVPDLTRLTNAMTKRTRKKTMERKKKVVAVTTLSSSVLYRHERKTECLELSSCHEIRKKKTRHHGDGFACSASPSGTPGST